jgi:Xaa-Pro aminopeptidase
MFTTDTYSQRRQQLAKDVKSGIILLPGNRESSMNYTDNLYHFRQDSCFLYFTGIDKPNLTVIIDTDSGKEYLFGDRPSIDDIVWTGPVTPLEEVASRAGIGFVEPAGSVHSMISAAIAKGQPVHFIKPYRPELVLQLSEWMDLHPQKINENVSVVLIKAIVAQRSIKSTEEIAEIEKAVNITVAMHSAAIRFSKEGMTEYEMAGQLQGIAVSSGGQLAFPTILTVHGEILHNHAGGNVFENGQMILCDSGAEAPSHYAGDMTRTFPVNKTFSGIQREAYDIVLHAHTDAVNMLAPGVLFTDVHKKACETLTDGLKQLGLMKGDTKEAVEAGAHALFFQCGLGHMMGLDVHDMENLGEQYVGYTDSLLKSAQFGLKSLRLGRPLEPGFVLTIEPGLYFIPTLIEKWAAEKMHTDFINYDKLQHFTNLGGIRIEDDYLITDTGSRLLGEPLTRTYQGIEAMRDREA